MDGRNSPSPAHTAGAGGFPGIAVVGARAASERWSGVPGNGRSDAAFDVRRAQNLIKSGRRAGWSRFLAGRVHQGEGAAMPDEPGEVWEVAKPQREHVVFAVEDDGLPPTMVERLLGNHEMTRRNLVPGTRQAAG